MRAAADMVCNLILVLAQIKVHALIFLFRIICRNNMKPIEGLKLLRCTFVTYQSTQGFSESNFVSAVDDFNQFKPSIEGCHRRVEQIVPC